VRLERLTRGHVLAAVAALALLLIMAMDWYGSAAADEAHRIQDTANTRGAQSGEVGRALDRDAQAIIARDEKNAWQADGFIDRVLLGFLLLSVALALAAAVFRSQGRRHEPPWTLTSAAALTATIAAMLVAYRIIQEPGLDALTNVKLGAPLALVALAMIALGSADAFQKEVDWSAMRDSADSAHSAESTEPADSAEPAAS
jgi:hypothetical protein